MKSKAAAISIGIHLVVFGVLLFALKNSDTITAEEAENLDVSWGHKTIRQKTAPKTITAPADSEALARPAQTGTTAESVNPQTEQNTGGSNSPLSITDPYYSRVRSMIQSKLQYPGDLIRRRITGQVTLKLVVLANGSLGQVGIEKSSGHDELDQLALKAVRSAAPYDSFTKDLERKIVLPVDFKH